MEVFNIKNLISENLSSMFYFFSYGLKIRKNEIGGEKSCRSKSQGFRKGLLYNRKLQNFKNKLLKKIFPKKFLKIINFLFFFNIFSENKKNAGQIFLLRKKSKELLKYIIGFLKMSSITNFIQLIEYTAADFLGQTGFDQNRRFEVIYILSSIFFNLRIKIGGLVGRHFNVLSIADIFPSAVWCEREIWDMFGIFFTGNIDLRRLLNDYGFKGFPLRKDYPTVGFKQVKFDEIFDSVVYEDIFLMQEEREVQVINPWTRSKLIKDEFIYDNFKTTSWFFILLKKIV